MNVVHGGRVLKICLLVGLIVPLAGCQQASQLFNQDVFLPAVLSTGPQVRPGVPGVLMIRLENTTSWPATVKIRIFRPSGIQTINWQIGGLATAGELIQNCNTDPPAIIRLQFLGEESSANLGGTEELLLPEAFVSVLGVTTIITSGPPPLELGTDFVCGDAIQYIVRSIPGQQRQFEIIAGVFRE